MFTILSWFVISLVCTIIYKLIFKRNNKELFYCDFLVSYLGSLSAGMLGWLLGNNGNFLQLPSIFMSIIGAFLFIYFINVINEKEKNDN
jgi:uncharacterized membrane protein YeaQ/YmgE (transglycosylase-associated protein family)